MARFNFNQQYSAWAAGLLVIAGAAFVLLGLPGFRTVVAIAVLFVLPPLLLIRATSLDVEEKIFFSFFIGIGLFSLLTWVVNQAVQSLRLSILAAYALVVVLSLFLPRILKQLQKKMQ